MKKLFFACIPALLLMSGTLFAQVDSDSTQLLDLEQNSVPPLEQDKAQPQEEVIQVPSPGRNQQINDPSSQQPKQQQNIRPNQQPAEQQTIPPPQMQNPVRKQNPSQRQGQNPVQQQTQPVQQQQQIVQPMQRQQQSPQPVQEQQQPVLQQIQQSPLMEERPVTSAPTNVKMTTPLISIDLIMDLYNKDIDFDIDYSGSAGAGVSNLGKKRPSEQEVQKMVTEQMDTTAAEPKKGAKEKKAAKEVPPREDGTRPYTPEDANYNKAMISLNNAQQLFASRRYAEALAEINRSIAFAPNIALSYSVKGSVHYMLRQVSEAKRSWERALELDPTMDNVRAILLRMY